MNLRAPIASLEQLETRRLLASFASVSSHGTLSIAATSKADTIVTQVSKSNVQAILNGATETFSKSIVKRIWIEAFGGNDKITNKTALPSTIIGDAGNDTIIGGGANDTIQAGSGDDHFDGGLGLNEIDEGSGNDAFDYSTEQGSTFFVSDYAEGFAPYLSIQVVRNAPGGGEDDALEQSNLSTFIASAGNDQISFNFPDGNAPTFSIYGGDGNDAMTTAGGQTALVNGGNGNDTISFNYDTPIDSIYGGTGNDVINDGSGYQTSFIDGGSGFDIDNVDPDQPVLGESMAEFTVPAGIEKYAVYSLNNLVVHGNGLDNTINVSASNVTVYGNGGNDQITALADINTDSISRGHVSLDGGSGNDTLHGSGTLSSTLKGSGGNDTLIGDGDINDQLSPASLSFVYEGDSGTDTADFSDSANNLHITLDNIANDITTGQKSNVESDVENIIGGSGNDFIAGNPSNNNLDGGAGDDTIWGSSGNDTLAGDAGHDQLHGQDGNDVLYGKDGHTDTLDGGDGTDKAQRDDSATIKDQVISIESFI